MMRPGRDGRGDKNMCDYSLARCYLLMDVGKVRSSEYGQPSNSPRGAGTCFTR